MDIFLKNFCSTPFLLLYFEKDFCLNLSAQKNPPKKSAPPSPARHGNTLPLLLFVSSLSQFFLFARSLKYNIITVILSHDNSIGDINGPY